MILEGEEEEEGGGGGGSEESEEDSEEEESEEEFDENGLLIKKELDPTIKAMAGMSKVFLFWSLFFVCELVHQ